MSIAKPPPVFARDDAWDALARFVGDRRPGTRVALVYGRRRQGKTVLLEALSEATGGLYWQARQQSATQNLASLSEALTAFVAQRIGGVAPIRLVSWDEALAALTSLGQPAEPVTVCIDEVGYLLDAVPGFASMLQAALSPLGSARQAGGTRLVLCGSAFGPMRRLVAADAPLRGRVDAEILVRPFDHRTAADFWGLRANPDAAFRLHALIGGTPAYREFTGEDAPLDGDIDRWATDHLLRQTSPLFREGRTVIAEDTELVDQALHWSVLGAIADGCHRRTEITAALGRPPTSLQHVLGTLIDAGWVEVEEDPLRTRRRRYVLAEPMIRTHRLVIEPNEARLVARGDRRVVWEDALPRVRAEIYGPHLEYLARTWVAAWASEATFDAAISLVGPSTISGRQGKAQLDVVGLEPATRGGTRVAVVGEVKAETAPIGVSELERLDAVIESSFPDEPRRLLVGRAGFTGELSRVARRRGDVVLVDLHRLFSGD